MEYYDKIKDSVKENNAGGNTNTAGSSNFDTLREAAEESSEQDQEKEGDDTKIEVLEEGLESRKVKQEKEPQTETKENNQSSENISSSGIEERLDKIIEQNERIIEVLESFGS